MARHCCDPACTKCRPPMVSRRKALEGLGVLAFLLVGWSAQQHAATGGGAPDTAPATARPGAAARQVTAKALLANDRLELSPRARHDLQADLVTPELRALLADLLTRHRLAVSVFATGHTKCVAGSNSISHHWYGAAADIWKVDGARVDAGNAAALAIVQALVGRGAARPRQIGHPFTLPENHLTGVWTDHAHRDHLHLSTYTGPSKTATDCGGGGA